jgi:hypothetical protein
LPVRLDHITERVCAGEFDETVCICRTAARRI